jgi:histidyl-tRNA synthetase
LELFPKETDQGLTLLFVNFGEKEQNHCMKLMHEVRANGIDCELYPTSAKIQKQMKYANDRKVQYVALIGEQEMNEELVLLKNMESGDQVEMSIDEVIHKLITNPAR